MHLESQRRVQADLDKDGFSTNPSEWDYEKDISKLFGGMVVSVSSIYVTEQVESPLTRSRVP